MLQPEDYIQIIPVDIEMEEQDPYILTLPISHYYELRDKFKFKFQQDIVEYNNKPYQQYVSWVEFHEFLDCFKRDLDNYLHYRKAP